LSPRWRTNINLQNNQGNTPLHIATMRCNKELVQLLLNNQAEVSVKNKYDKVPLDIAKKHDTPNGQEIVDILEKSLSKLSDQAEMLSKQEKEVNEKLRDFVKDFVLIYESSLSEYYERLENQRAKPGKWSSFVSKVIATGKGGAEEVETEGIMASSIVGINVLQSTISSIGSNYNRKELKKLIHQLYTFKKDPGKVREELVKSGIEIFQSFESQFVQAVADGSWERAMEKLAHDAVNRVINYCRKNTAEGFSTSSVTKGVVFGESKKYKHTSTGAPHVEQGHTVEGKDSNSWNTAELFDKAGLVTIHKDGTAEKYYNRKGGKSDKYGYRLLFKWESEDPAGLAKKLKVEYQEEKPTGKEYKYILKPDEKEKLKNVLLSEINSQNPKLLEERLVENFQEGIEQVKQSAEESFNELEGCIDRNFSELSSYVENNQNEIKEIFREVVRHHQAASQERQEIANCVEEGRKENREGFQDASQERQRVADDNKKEHERTQQAINKLTDVVAQNSEQRKVPVWFDVRESARSFTGRQEQLHQIATAIKQEIVVISGLGGVGKSELAIKYAREHYDKESSVIWIGAETQQSLKRSFRELAFKLKIPTAESVDGKQEERNIKYVAREVYECFYGMKSLFIFDNAEVSEDTKEFFPSSTPPGYDKPHVLVTSRERDWEIIGEKIKTVNLGQFSPEEAEKFVKDVLKIEEGSQKEDIGKLTKELQYFPLALRQAVAYIDDMSKKVKRRGGEGFKISDYLEKYNQQASSLLNFRDYSTGVVSTTWAITIDRISGDQENGTDAMDVFNIMAYLDPDTIKIEEVFLKLISDEDKLWGAVELLNRYSMINLENGGASNIHRLVQKVTRIRLVENHEEGKVLQKALKLFKDNINSGNVSHAVSVCRHIIDFSGNEAVGEYRELIKEFGSLPSEIINKFGADARYQEAYSFRVEILQLLKSTLGNDDLDILSLENNAAYILYRQGKYDEALTAYEGVLEERKKKLGLTHPDTLSTMSSKATVLNNQGKYEDALQILHTVYEIQKDSLGVDDPRTLGTMHEKARTLDNLGRYKDAITAFREVLDKRKQQLSLNNPDTLYTLHGLGRALSNQGEYERALETYKEALEKRKEKFDDNYPDVLATVNNIAVVLNKQGKYDEALEKYKEVLEKRKEKLGEDHPSSLYTLHGMAKVLNNQGKYGEALKKYEEVLEKRKKVLGTNQPATLSTMHEIATALSYLGKYDEALDRYKEVLEKRNKKLGEDHPSTLTTRNGMAGVLQKQGKYGEALKEYGEVLEKRNEKLGEDHPSTLTTRNGMADVLHKQGNYGEALKEYGEVLEKRNEKLGENHPDTKKTKDSMNEVSQLLGSSGEHETQTGE
jgi:tetratricopeptide (TPR) repeat protein